jgi:hypothetical protein
MCRRKVLRCLLSTYHTSCLYFIHNLTKKSIITRYNFDTKFICTNIKLSTGHSYVALDHATISNKKYHE